MKHYISILITLFSLNFVFAAEELLPAKLSQQDVEAIIQNGEKGRAVLLQRDRQEVLPKLKFVILTNPDLALKKNAIDVVNAMPGMAAAFRDAILNDKGYYGYYKHDPFEMLAYMRTEESLKMLGAFLFDPSNPSTDKPATSDIGAPIPRRIIALQILERAKLEGAPLRNEMSATDYLEEYKAWWIKKYGK